MVKHFDYPSIFPWTFIRVSGPLLQLFWEDTKAFPGQPDDVISPTCPWSASWHSPGWTCPKHLQEASKPAQTTSIDSSQCRGVATLLHLSWMTELLTLSLRESPATLWSKLISAACISDFILWVTHYPQFILNFDHFVSKQDTSTSCLL